MITYSCKSCRFRNRCPDRSRRYTCKDYKRKNPQEQQLPGIKETDNNFSTLLYVEKRRKSRWKKC
ncbi:MAG: hypothetical protein E7249_01760 [Paenibacillaceae bacterium]|nr:hypothetical protein [Paenibacillaceae bacterium]